MDILFVNCCISQKKEESRTLGLCRAFIEAYEKAHPQDRVSELALEDEALSWMTAPRLNQRDGLVEKGDYDDELFCYARRFAQADKIIVGAPYWDKSFPALLKVYIENVSVNGIAFHYTENGPEGLCRARKLLYLLTCGGKSGRRIPESHTFRMYAICSESKRLIRLPPRGSTSKARTLRR